MGIQEDVGIDKLVSAIAGLGVPGLVLLVATSVSGFAGAAAMTTALAALGPGGMVGGVVTLGIIGLIAHGLSRYGLEAILGAVLKELYKNGETADSIHEKISSYPISRDMKRHLHEAINRASSKS